MNSAYSGHPSPSQRPHDMPLVRWVWRSYFRTSLIPLLVVEVALIVLYFLSNSFSNHYNTEAVRNIAEQTVRETVNREASSINQQLRAIKSATSYLAEHTRQIMAGEIPARSDRPENYSYTEEGVFYSVRDTGRGALFYSGVKPVGEKERKKAYLSAALDSAYLGVLDTFPLVVQLYYNTHDSMNRIYPYFDVLEQYEAKMDIPEYNFYYEADAKNNPEKRVVWTDVYVDPAGQGWMTSAIAPVYTENFLEGVIGIDITVSTIIEQVLNLEIPWDGYGLLLGRDGTIIAMPKEAENDWSLNELTTYQYTDAIRQDTFKPESFNLFKRLADTDIGKGLEQSEAGLEHLDIGEPRILSWSTIPETGWKLVISIPDKRVYETANSLAERLSVMAWLVVAAMVVFYMVFFTILYYRAKKMSEFVSKPLEDIDHMTQQISKGQYHLASPDFAVIELSRTAKGIQKMGIDLERQNQLTAKAEKALADLNSKLQAVFDLSPDGFVTINTDDKVVLVNPAFCKMTATNANDWVGLSNIQFWNKLKLLMENPDRLDNNESSFTFRLKQPEWRVIRCQQRTDFESNTHNETKYVIYLSDVTMASALESMKNNFLASVAHELRTPMSSVLGYAELLSSKELDKNQQALFHQAIVDESHNLVKLINDILTIAQIDSASGKIASIEAYSIDELINETIKNHYDERQKGKINLQLHADGCFVLLNDEVFTIILKHIIDNAIKFSAVDELIEVCTEADESSNLVYLRIIDHGIGMTAEQSKFAFERFWRADNTGNTPGTGLGLSVAKELAEKMNLTLEIDSTPGHGTSVTLTMPIMAS